MFSKYTKNEILNHRIKKAVGYTSTALVVFFIYLFIINAYLSTATSENVNTYITIVSRISIFYLGSIVTMSVYIYTKTYSMSTIQFTSPITSLTMGIGVIFSFLSMITLPSKLYYPTPIFQSYIKLITSLNWNWQMFLSFLNIISFLIATAVFVVTLIRFIYSFNIDAILNDNYIAVAKICGSKETQIKNKSEVVKYTIEPLSETEMLRLEKKLNIYNQNLLYLLTLKNEVLTEKYLYKWRDIISNTQERLFHSPVKSNINKKLYDKTLELSNKLIIETADNITLKQYHEILLKTIFNSIPLFEEQYIKKEKLKEIQKNYVQNYDFLLKTCYIELNKIIEYLYRNQKNSDILQKMSNNEVGFLDSTVNQSKFISEKANLEIKDKNNYMEDLLIGMLFNIVNKNNNVDLPVVLSLLFKAQKESKKNNGSTDNVNAVLSFVTAGVFEDLGNALEGIKEKQDTKQESKFLRNIEDAGIINEEILEIVLSDKTIKYIIIVIIKANEIENYKAVGYLIKRLCNHLSFDEILKNLHELEKSIYDNGYRELLLSKISLNEYSLKYCFNKTKILLFLQSCVNKSEMIKEYKNTIEIEYKKEIIETLKDKHKEYNMSCIKEKSLNGLEDIKRNKIGFK
ncbi:hypothetical protein [Lysinibacillus sp. C5.1]|uniref:hypothetical protein n=1 Tax=Lysinibacillus sp. C5.1 TaxID=2796169 RepID=UPI00308158DA